MSLISGFIANDRAARMAAHNPPLVIGGKFNLRGIMHRAVRFARDLYRPGSSWSWTRCMTEGLRSAWQAAKAEMVLAKRATVTLAARTSGWTPAARVPAARRSPFTYDRSLARTTHGW